MQIEISHDISENIARLNQLGRKLLEKHPSPDARLLYIPDSPINAPVVQIKYPDTRKGEPVIRFRQYNLNSELVHSQHVPTHVLHAQVKQQSEESFDREAFSVQLHNQLLRELAITQGAKLLYLGPRTGELLAKILDKNAEVLAIDFSQKAVTHLNRKFRKQVAKNQLIIGAHEFTELPSTRLWQPGQMDHVLAPFSTELHHEPGKLFAMVKDALKSNGIFTIAELTPFHEELCDHLRHAGLNVEKVKVTQVNLPWHTEPEYLTIIKARKPK